MLFKKNDTTEDGNYQGISIVAQAGKVLRKLAVACLSKYGWREGILPAEHSDFRQVRSIDDKMFVVRRLHEPVCKKSTPLYACFIDLSKAYDYVDRELLWAMLKRFGLPPRMLAIICQFNDGI